MFRVGLTVVLIVASGLIAVPAAAQEAGVLAADQQLRTRVGLVGMGGMAAWSTASLIGGVVGATRSAPGSTEAHFHTLNAVWGAVNLSIFGVGLVAVGAQSQSPFGDREALLKNGRTMAGVFAINGGLDIAYLTTGAILTAVGTRDDLPRLRGYGPALLIQGGFLLIFDLAMVAFHLDRNASLPSSQTLGLELRASPAGFSVRF